MRTTIAIADELLAAARRRAQQRGQSLGSLVEDALRRELAADQDASPRPTVPVFSGGSGPRPGIDLRSNRALHEALDEGVDLDSRR
ncbi:antitoxin [Mycolicibacterium boenickei]